MLLSRTHWLWLGAWIAMIPSGIRAEEPAAAEPAAPVAEAPVAAETPTPAPLDVQPEPVAEEEIPEAVPVEAEEHTISPVAKVAKTFAGAALEDQPRRADLTQETSEVPDSPANESEVNAAVREEATEPEEASVGPTIRDLLPLISWTFPQFGDLIWEAWSQGPLTSDFRPGEMLADEDEPLQLAQARTQEPQPEVPQDEPKPAEPTPAEPAPAEPTPAEPTPAEPTPAEPTPAEPTPAEPTPAEPTPAEPTPAEPTPAEPMPDEPKPAEPAEPTPAKPTPAEPTPAESAPATPEPAAPMPAAGEPLAADIGTERTPAPAEELPLAEPMVDAKELLRRAYEASKTAKTAESLTEVINDCLAALAQSPEQRWSDYAAVVLGWAYNARGELVVDTDPQQALSDFAAAIEHQPAGHQAYYNRGISLAQAGQFAEAERDLTRSLELNPQHVKALFNRGELYFFQGKYELAMKDYDGAVARDPRNAPAYNARGFIRYLQGNQAAALRDFNLAISIDSKLISALVNRGDLYAAQGDYTLAIADYRRATQLDERSSRAWLSWGWLLATCPMDSMRNTKLAVDYAQAALELEGDGDYRYWEVLAAAQANAEAFDKADASQARAIELAPQNQKPRMERRLEQYRNKQPHREMARMAGAGINR